MESTKLSARLAGYQDAIREAREAGVTWKQLASLFNADAKYFSAVACRKKEGRYKVPVQLPLPEPAVVKAATARRTETMEAKPVTKQSNIIDLDDPANQ